MKIALGIEYDGSRYHGWQKQKQVITVEEKLENALSIIANHKIQLVCAGRTDTGVHSIGQVVHFNTFSIRRESAWVLGVNSYLPRDISVQWMKIVPESFDARHSAISRCYRYFIYNCKYRSAIFYSKCYHFFKKKLNVKKMQIAGSYLLGEHDFSSFRGKGCQSCTPWRKIFSINVFQIRKMIIVDIEANSFLYHMVRNIIGCLIDIGSSKKKIKWIINVLKMKDRKFASFTAQSSGLYFMFVNYPNKFHFPKKSIKNYLII